MIKGKANGQPTKPRQTAPKKERTNADNIAEFKGKKSAKEKANGKAGPGEQEPLEDFRKPQLKKVSHTDKGQAFIPGTEPVIDATLEALANKMEESRDLMMGARKQYTIDEENLRLYMEENNIKTPQPLSNNRVAFLEDKIKARVRKDKSSSEDVEDDI